MKRLVATFLTTIVAAGLGWDVLAGDLDSPGAPAPTMSTLQQVFDRLERLTGDYVVPKTGQAICTDEAGVIVECAGTGQDGEYEMGASVSPRFTDHGNGTIRDNLTGLVWLKNANCFGLTDWISALSHANNLTDGACGLTDGSEPGDWRLPNVKEAMSLIDYGRFVPALPEGHPFADVPPAPPSTMPNWTSSSMARLSNSKEGHARTVHYNGGYVGLSLKSEAHYVWPIRGGL